MERIKTHADLVEAIREVVAYNWDAEARDYEEHEGDGATHIFTTLKALDDWSSDGKACTGPCTAGLMPGESCEVCGKVCDIADMMQGQGGCTG